MDDYDFFNNSFDNSENIPSNSKVPKFMYLNLSFYFNLLCHFNVMLSIIYLWLLPRRYTSIIQCRCYFTPHHFHSNLSTNCTKRSPFLQFPSPFCYSQTTCYQHTLPLFCLTTFPTIIKLFFHRRFSLSAS